ncbi:hypothetical protein PCK1_002470 [Pneumocystis canis]|nr:hypothetical protein PCK1_002470 [Pneumocystis canis]
MLKKNKESMKQGTEPLDGEIYEVEKIYEEFVQEDGNILYRISWKGYSKDFDTWEPIENLIDCKHALEDWNRLKNLNTLKKRQKVLTLNKDIKKKKETVCVNNSFEDNKIREQSLRKSFFLKNTSKSNKKKNIIENKTNDIKINNDKNSSHDEESKVYKFRSKRDSFPCVSKSFKNNLSENDLSENFFTENHSISSISEKSPSVSEKKMMIPKVKRKNKLLCNSLTDSLSSKSDSLDNSLSNSDFECITEKFSHIQDQIVVKFSNLNKSPDSNVKINEPDLDFYKENLKSSIYMNKSKLNFMTPLFLKNDREMFLEKLDMLLGPPVFLINEIDSDPSPADFEFITSYKYGVGVQPRNPLFISGCSCPKDGCDLDNPSSCQCLEDSDNKSFSYDEYGRLRCNIASIIYECNENCDCGIKCPNRVVQRGRKIPLDIFKTKYKGWGLRCPRFIKAGTFIGVYLGELICQAEAEVRGKKYDHVGITYLFDLDLFEDQVDDYYTIDAQYCGDVTRFINHSCDPNLAIYTVLRDKSDPKIYDLALFAIKDIPPLEELCFDYSGGNNEDELGFIGNCSSSKYTNLKNKRPCYCGSANCRGWLFG